MQAHSYVRVSSDAQSREGVSFAAQEGPAASILHHGGGAR
jgi:hypothetical protein